MRGLSSKCLYFGRFTTLLQKCFNPKSFSKLFFLCIFIELKTNIPTLTVIYSCLKDIFNFILPVLFLKNINYTKEHCQPCVIHFVYTVRIIFKCPPFLKMSKTYNRLGIRSLLRLGGGRGVVGPAHTRLNKNFKKFQSFQLRYFGI